MTYKVVFDGTQQGYPWWVLVFGLIFVAMGVSALRYKNALAKFLSSFSWIRPAQATSFWKTGTSLWGVVMIVIGFCGACSIFTVTYMPYSQTQQILTDGQAAVVEGPVTDFTPLPSEDHGLESFSVNGVKFSYSDAVVSPGFHTVSTHGGPIKENGIYVRIHYYTDQNTAENVIVKLEIRE